MIGMTLIMENVLVDNTKHGPGTVWLERGAARGVVLNMWPVTAQVKIRK